MVQELKVKIALTPMMMNMELVNQISTIMVDSTAVQHRHSLEEVFIIFLFYFINQESYNC